MDVNTLTHYLNVFARLNCKVSREFGKAPHKPILLLAVLDEIEASRVADNFITLSVDLVAGFTLYFDALVRSGHWLPRIENPFRYLFQEGFWHFISEDMEVSPELRPYTVNQLRESFDGVRLSPDLWEIVSNSEGRQILRTHLLQTYFNGQVIATPDTDRWILTEAERLKAEANAPFNPRRLREGSDVGYYVRHALFPRVVKELYSNTCSVCRIAARVSGRGNIVDAAHIQPFAEFHNDDPRNGIALCKNHHWGFDHGWFTVTPQYRVKVSPRLQAADGYITEDQPITLPVNPVYSPAPDALAWHGENVLQQ